MEYLKYILVLNIIMNPGISYADKIVIGFGINRPPFILEKENRGIEVDIVKQALALKGHEVVIKHFRQRQLIPQMKKDSALDAVTTITVKATYNFSGVFYSDNFIDYQNLAVSLKSNNFSIHEIRDLAGLRVGAWELARSDLGEKYRQVVDKLGSDYFEYSNQDAQIDAFWNRSSDVIILDKSIFEWKWYKLSKQFNTSKAVTFHEILPKNKSYGIVFKNIKYRDDFNDGLRMLHASGEYQGIYNRYLKPQNLKH